jgi:PST family polysaccharide transporter/teichuronic acid exporter
MGNSDYQVSLGMRWMFLAKVVISVTAVIKISVLVRFLDASVFGLMALITVFIGFLDLFMDMGITSAILHKQKITKKQYSSLYWLSLFIGLAIYFILYQSAPFIASLYDERSLIEPIQVASFGIVLASLGRQFLTVDQKNLRFFRIAVIEIVASIASLFLAIYLAATGMGIYALVYSMLMQFFIINVTYLFIGMKEYKISVGFDFFEIWPFLKIGLFQLAGQSVNYINKEFDVILIGKIFGTEILGGYSLAKQLVNKPASIVNPIVNRVATPTLALIQKNFMETKDVYFSFTRLVSTVNFCAYAALAFFAYPIVIVLYGDKYEYIVIFVQILCAYVFLRSLGNPLGSLVIALGRTDYGLYWNIYTTLFMPIAIILGSYYGLIGITCSLVIVEIFFSITRWPVLVSRLINSNFHEYLLSQMPSYKQFKALLRGRFSVV